MKILYNFATRSRPEKCFRCIDNILGLARHNEFVIVLTVDLDDPSMCNDVVIERLKGYSDKVMPVWGTSLSKIDAINKNVYCVPEWDVLINESDDMVFLKEGFDLVIIEAFEKYFPNLDGFLHINDGNQNRLATMSIEGRKFYDRFGFVYHPDFISVYCDNWIMDVAKLLGKYHYLGDDVNLVKHEHPLLDRKFKMDTQYKHTESFYEQDKKTYLRHKANNYYL